MLSPNSAFALGILGVLGIYCGFVWPGKIFPGLAGAALALISGWSFWRTSITPVGLELLAVAAALFALDASVRTYFVAGTLGTVALAAGAVKLVDLPLRVAPWLAIPLCSCFGAVTMLLSYGARRARRNKRADFA